MNKETALKNLVTIRNTAADLGIDVFLIAGTLLGCIREKDFIAHDYDTDLGIFAKNYKPELIPALGKQGFCVLRRFGDLKTGYEIAMHRNNEWTDICLFYDVPGEDKVFHCAWKTMPPDWKMAFAIKYKFTKFELIPMEFKEELFAVPDDPIRYLSETYPQWDIPNPNYDYTRDPLNREITDIKMPMLGEA